ncbi:MAG: chlorophyll synthesis pathway protein BchC [Pseudomonadota bacterium]
MIDAQLEVMDANAVVISEPSRIELWELHLKEAGPSDIVVETAWSGISSGTERKLFDGSMPPFPGLAYPLVPGYEAVGYVAQTDEAETHAVGDLVFVPGAQCYTDAQGLFGASASQLVTGADRVIAVPSDMREQATLLSLAATAHHALALTRDRPPELIVGHGVLGRLLARMSIAMGNPAPTVWENDRYRRSGGSGYEVTEAKRDSRSDFGCIMDASGADSILNEGISRLATGGQLVLAGFYNQQLSFDFVPAFVREAKIQVAREFQPEDIRAALNLVKEGKLMLADLITHRAHAEDARSAYDTAFRDSGCVKMILDWRLEA